LTAAGDIRVVEATHETQVHQARELLSEYLGQQIPNYPDPVEARRTYDRELANLHVYKPLLLGLVNNRPAGVVGLRRETDEIAEMKRLYVREEFRGTGLGTALCRRLMEAASARGFTAVRLDVHSSRAPAIRLYTSLGFEETEPWEEAWADVRFLALRLPPT
jgi:ribosomal protein S18 acetylase RimI-like enzyme